MGKTRNCNGQNQKLISLNYATLARTKMAALTANHANDSLKTAKREVRSKAIH